MQLFGLNTGNNVSLYAVPAAFGLAMAPHLYAVGLVTMRHSSASDGFNFSFPKKTREGIAGTGLSQQDQDRYLRAEAANDNNFVGLPFFAAAVVAGNVARLPTTTLNRAVGIYLASRTAYNLLYILGSNNAMGLARTAAWVIGSFTCAGLFCEAAHVFYNLI